MTAQRARPGEARDGRAPPCDMLPGSSFTAGRRHEMPAIVPGSADTPLTAQSPQGRAPLPSCKRLGVLHVIWPMTRGQASAPAKRVRASNCTLAYLHFSPSVPLFAQASHITDTAHHEPPVWRQKHGAQAHAGQRHFQREPRAPPPACLALTAQVDTRVESIDVKLAKLNAELSGYQQRLAKMRDGPGKSAIKQKALKVLQQRKMYESQRDQLQQQSWNMEQAGMMQDNLKNTMTTVDAMKTTTKELRKQYGKVDIDKIERLQDEMADLMDMGNDIQESISRSYDVPEEVDEAELDAELDALGEEVELEGIGESSGVPGYMLDETAPPQFIDEPPEQNKVKEAAG